MDFSDSCIEKWHGEGCDLVDAGRDSEEISKAAVDVIKRAYYGYVQGLAEEIVDQLRANDGHMIESEMEQWTYYMTNGCRWAIESPLPELACLVSDNEAPPANDNPEQRAATVVRMDLHDMIVDPSSYNLPIKCTSNGVILEGRENL